MALNPIKHKICQPVKTWKSKMGNRRQQDAL